MIIRFNNIMTIKNKINIANRVFKSLFFKEMPNYSIIYIDGRCNMNCGFCFHAAVDARKTPIMSAENWGNVFKRAKSLSSVMFFLTKLESTNQETYRLQIKKFSLHILLI